MSKDRATLRSAIVFLAVLAVAPGVYAAQPGFDEFRCWLAGSWDNVEQATADIRNGVEEPLRHPRRAMTYVPVASAAIRGQLFAIRTYTDQGIAGPLSRVSLHRFRPAGDLIVHEFMFLHDKARWGNLGADLASLEALTEDDVRINDDCAMFWRWADDHFEGSTVEGRCITSSFTPEPIRIEGHGELWPGRLVRHDRNFTLTGESLPVPGGDTPEVFLKVRSYPEESTCTPSASP